MRILGVPAFRNRTLNPYNALLYRAIIRAGATVDEATPRNLFGIRHDVVHLHWPEYLFSAPGLARAVLQAFVFVLVITMLRGRRTKIVWTVHNLAAHERRHLRLEDHMWRWFVDRVDGYIALSDAGRDTAQERFPALTGRPGFVIPHGHYRDEYPDGTSRAAARRKLLLPMDGHVICVFGAIRPYKNIPALIDTFRSIDVDDWRLVVAGHAPDDRLSAELRDRAGDDSRIRLDLSLVPGDRVQVYLRAADLLVFPYRDILNSGSALLALSFGRPVLVPDLGAMADLRQFVGDAWVRTYDGPLSARTLLAAMEWAENTPREALPTLTDLDWDSIARKTLAAYDTVRRLPPATPRSRSGAATN